jgi:hypothetical protein
MFYPVQVTFPRRKKQGIWGVREAQYTVKYAAIRTHPDMKHRILAFCIERDENDARPCQNNRNL